MLLMTPLLALGDNLQGLLLCLPLNLLGIDYPEPSACLEET